MKKLSLLIAIVLAASCMRAEREMPVEAAKSVQDASAGRIATVQRSQVGAPLGVGFSDAPAMPRMIVRTADVRIIVGDTSKTIDAVTRAVERAGGYVSGSNVWREGELLRAKLTLRVPSQQLTPTLAAIRALAKRVDNEIITSEDVSQEYVDLDARVRNLEATEEELRQLLTVARQNSKKATEVLEVHRQLTQIRGEIEQVKGRMRYLSQVTAMSSISLDVTPDAIAQPVVEPGWQPLVVAKNAMRALVGVMQSGVNVAIWFVIYVLPLFAMVALAVAVVWKVAARLRASSLKA